MLSKLHTAQVNGIRADIIDIEVDISRGIHAFSIVGLPDKAIEEAKDRINTAIKNSGFKSPEKSSRRIIISLAPANLKKEGTAFDLAIALACLLAGSDITFPPDKKMFLGELGLSGDIRPIKGILLLVKAAKEHKFEEVYVPEENVAEAALIKGIKIYGCKNFRQVVHHLCPIAENELGEKPAPEILIEQEVSNISAEDFLPAVDFSDIKSQSTAKRGLEIAAAGCHNVAMSGPPGTGKTMLAKAFAGILPPLTYEEIIEVTGIHSAAGTLIGNLISNPPFRSPHHTSSYVSIVGGGAWPKPGEITLANRGVLFMDEFPEFDKRVVESLRQPLEDRVISISRSKGSVLFPANFILVATMNPCPCGHKGSKTRECICTAGDLLRYQRKLSGPIMDRIDLWLEVPQVDHAKLSDRTNHEENSANIKQRVLQARARQTKRFEQAGLKIKTNSEMSSRDLLRFAALTDSCSKLLNDSAKRLDLSARAYHRIIKLARTIADLAGAEDIKEDHLLEALQYRPKLV